MLSGNSFLHHDIGRKKVNYEIVLAYLVCLLKVVLLHY